MVEAFIPKLANTTNQGFSLAGESIVEHLNTSLIYFINYCHEDGAEIRSETQECVSQKGL